MDADCEFLAYNRDFTSVCTLTGLCHGPMLCSRVAGVGGTNLQSDVDTYEPRLKQCQQVRNSTMRLDFLRPLVFDSGIIEAPVLSDEAKRALMYQLADLWGVFVAAMHKTGTYVHRKDRRALVVAALFALPDGLCCDEGVYAVVPHPGVRVRGINKKKKYSHFCVSDIRYGQNMLRRALRPLGANLGVAVDVTSFL
ncbi:Hypothetical Protein FCC1311_058022 [Hondaea fermentalgiana]|uniref:Uncharacterized protein n=1 Tax=Hondaea fermentalgiana TaxID=2315210 RepID=A0A2R5GMP7_9STRA|nr:Hypothetical Protein FCC1311_058022 [Hondaea fermentalgiana]|eukprot:GBG29581.1 Hypothetical Protein FCC1311_058022 [Hondaea fermentalgiana]